MVMGPRAGVWGFMHLAACVFWWSALAFAQQDVPTPSPYATGIPPWFKETFLDFPEDVRDAAKSGKRVMLYFGQDGCPYCNRLMETHFGQRDIARMTQRHFDAIALNLWGDRETVWMDGKTRTEKELGAHLKVQFTPVLLFLDERGSVVLRINGLYPLPKFRAALDYVALKKETSVKFSDWLAQASGPPETGVLHEHPLFPSVTPKLDRSQRPAGKPLAVFFEHRHCAECDELHAGPLKDPGALQLLEKFEIARIDIRATRKMVAPGGKAMTEAQFARSLNITFAPSIVFFDERGREVFRTEAYLRTFHIRGAL
ncbi:MAG: thioredoxin family protein, partial [Burkholderiales bacterium]